MTLSVIAFCMAAAHETDWLHKFMAHVPPEYAKHVPLVYITIGVIAFLLLKSAHEDDLKNLSHPKIALEWLNDDATPPSLYTPVRVYNDGDSAAFQVKAEIRVGEYDAIRIELPSSVAPHSGIFVTPMIEHGKRKPLASREHAQKFFRLGLDWDNPIAREGRRQRALLRTIYPVPVPDEAIPFNVTYEDFDSKSYTTPHVLTYFDADNEIRIRLATAADLAD